jgi:hypothetical protein
VHAEDRVLIELSSLNAEWMKLPCTRIRSQSAPKWPSTTLPSVGSPSRQGVRDAAVRDEVARARGVTAELRTLGVAVLRLLDLAADGRDEDVSAEADARVPKARTAST